jgi:hypothetical protein
MNKQTAVEWLQEQLFPKILTQEQYYCIEKAKEMEKEQSQNYAIFAIRCDRTEMRILEFNDYIKLEEKEDK